MSGKEAMVLDCWSVYESRQSSRLDCWRYIFMYSKFIKGSTHYLGDKQDFDVLSNGPSSGEGPSLQTLKSCLLPR